MRQALYYGMDKKSIIDAIYYGLPTETETYLPRQSWAFNPDLPKHAYDPAKAKQILDAAGWKPGAGGIREKNGRAAGVHQLDHRRQPCARAGTGTAATELARHRRGHADQEHARRGDLGRLLQSVADTISVMVGQDEMTGPDPDVTTYYSSKAIPVKGGAGQNTMQYANPKVDELLAQGATTLDQKQARGDLSGDASDHPR